MCFCIFVYNRLKTHYEHSCLSVRPPTSFIHMLPSSTLYSRSRSEPNLNEFIRVPHLPKNTLPRLITKFHCSRLSVQFLPSNFLSTKLLHAAEVLCAVISNEGNSKVLYILPARFCLSSIT